MTMSQVDRTNISECPHTGKILKSANFLSPQYGVSGEGVVYYLEASNPDYGPDYFLEEYQKQYGKNYQDDETNLRRLASRRLKRISRFIRPRSRLLEIGTATGFFLDEARNTGLEVEGVEISDYAANLARDRLRLSVKTGSFIEMEFDGKYDIICAYYVLEHFRDQKALFEKISNLLNPGGFFSFACPSTNGPVYRTAPHLWMKEHPKDHFADYSPASLKKIFPMYGMRLLESYPASYHPERIGKRSLWRILGSFYPFFADLFCYGDTMEGLAQKIGR